MTGSPQHLASSAQLGPLLEGYSAADVVLLAAHALRVGSLDYALAICESREDDEEPALLLTRAAALFGLGRTEPAIELVERVRERAPEHLAAKFYRAQMAQQAGDQATASALLLEVVERFPDFPGAMGTLATLRMPGPPYRDVLRRVHELLAPKSYLEIGVESGATLALARGAQRVIGVDPDDSKLQRNRLPPQTRFFATTSDAFFAEHTPVELLGEHRLDLGYIDGMHWFEYALRDFINVEAWSSPSGTIVLHDCLPLVPLTASRERRSRFWVGDVWKLVCILRELRPDLRIKIIATAPSGLCVVRGLDPSSRVLAEALPAVVERYRALPYPAPAFELPEGFELVPASEEGVQAALA